MILGAKSSRWCLIIFRASFLLSFWFRNCLKIGKLELNEIWIKTQLFRWQNKRVLRLLICFVQIIDEPFLVLDLVCDSMFADSTLEILRTLFEYLLWTLLYLLEFLMALKGLAFWFFTDLRYCVVSIFLNILVQEVLLSCTNYIDHFGFLFCGFYRFNLVLDLVLQSFLILFLLYSQLCLHWNYMVVFDSLVELFEIFP